MSGTNKPEFKLSFFGMVAAVMAALKLKEYFDKNSNSEGRIALENDEDEAVSLLNTELPTHRTPGRKRSRTCCVCCGMNCGLFCKALGIVTALFVGWYTIKFVIWAVTPSPTGLENMPEYSNSLGCLNAAYMYNDGQDKIINVPISSGSAHALEVSGGAVGTVVIHTGSPELTEVQYKIGIRAEDKAMLEQVTLTPTESDQESSHLRIGTPPASSSCLRYDIQVFLPSNLKDFDISSQTPAQIKFGQVKQALDKFSIVLSATSANNMVIPHANLTAKDMTLEVYRGWIVGSATVVDNLVVSTEHGDGTANVRVHPDPSSLQVAKVETATGSGRTDVFFTSDKAYPHRQISSSHTSSRESSELYLTYKEAEFSGLVSLKSRSYSASGLHPFTSTQWTHWVGSQDGTDQLSVNNLKGWTGLYF